MLVYTERPYLPPLPRPATEPSIMLLTPSPVHPAPDNYKSNLCACDHFCVRSLRPSALSYTTEVPLSKPGNPVLKQVCYLIHRLFTFHRLSQRRPFWDCFAFPRTPRAESLGSLHPEQSRPSPPRLPWSPRTPPGLQLVALSQPTPCLKIPPLSVHTSPLVSSSVPPDPGDGRTLSRDL